MAACDLAIASDRAQFGTSGVKLGLFCATPSVPLSRNIGRKRALEMLFTGNFVDAARAKEWGLVNHVVPHDELEEAVQKLVLDISDKPAVAISMGKVRGDHVHAPVRPSVRLWVGELQCATASGVRRLTFLFPLLTPTPKHPNSASSTSSWRSSCPRRTTWPTSP